MAKRIIQEYKQYLKDPQGHYSLVMDQDNIYKWEFILFGPEDSIYEGGAFNGEINFPKSYPNNSPKVKFNSQILHPNVYPNGDVCISILHEGIDHTGYEEQELRWKPIHGVNTIMTSIYSLLIDISIDSPANVDAAILYKNDYEEFEKQVFQIVAQSHT